jgi:hypothetical protein
VQRRRQARNSLQPFYYRELAAYKPKGLSGLNGRQTFVATAANLADKAQVRALEYQKRDVIHYHALITGVEDLRRLYWMDRWHELAGYGRIEPIESAVVVLKGFPIATEKKVR